MNKTAIKNYAIWARRKLIADITYTAGLLGITEKGIAKSLPQSTKDMQFFDVGTKEYTSITKEQISQRDALVNAIEAKAKEIPFKDAFQYIVEEVAYTWFNRLIAIRFMEVNDYLPSRIRVLSSDIDGKIEPDFVTKPFDTDLDFTPYEKDVVFQLKEENKLDELFRMLFVKQCNKLNDILPGLFEVTSDYTELLLTLSFTDQDGVVFKLVNDISEDDFNVSQEGQVEIIGWMYQYYNTEPKDQVFANLKKNIKISKDNIPAATQLFTPDWIVRYMVENSLGRIWIEKLLAEGSSKTEKELAEDFGWKYYLEEAEQEPEVAKQLVEIRKERKDLTPEDLKVIDPCMGSGHILVYAFDVLMQIYESAGYMPKEAARLIIENNLYGLDIDDRAYQLSYFALMMKARQYSRRIFSESLTPNVYAIEESNSVNRAQLKYFGSSLKATERLAANKQMEGLLTNLKDAKEYGSIIQLPAYDWELLHKYADSYEVTGQMSLDSVGIEDTQILLKTLVNIGQTLGSKYHAVITNPPYMGSSGMSVILSEYVKKHYPASKTDLFAVFIEQCMYITASGCYQAMITQHGWMFLSSFEDLRENILRVSLVNMVHLGARAFEEISGEVVQTTSFVMQRSPNNNYRGTYCRLVEQNSQQGKNDKFFDISNRYYSKQRNYENLPGIPIAYWANEKIIAAFKKYENIASVARPRLGFATGDNERFMRLWFEPSADSIGFRCYTREEALKSGRKWFPTNKGGTYRKWYGNLDLVVNWENDGELIRNFKDENGNLRSRPQNLSECFSEGITWTVICNHSSFRYSPKGMLYNNKGPILGWNNDCNNLLFLGYLNSIITEYFLQILSPTLGFESGYVGTVPYYIPKNQEIVIKDITQDCISKSKTDWNSFETSWDFKKHPLI